MKNRFYLSIAASLFLGLGMMFTLSLSSHAQQNQPPAKQVPQRQQLRNPSLKCEYSHSDVSVNVKVTNTTGQTMPKGAKILAKQVGLSTTETLSHALAANDFILFTLGGTWTDAKPCTAVYLKN